MLRKIVSISMVLGVIAGAHAASNDEEQGHGDMVLPTAAQIGPGVQGRVINHQDTGVRVDHVDNAMRFLETLVADRQGKPVWSAFEIGANMEGDQAARVACIRKQTAELKAWTSWFENPRADASIPKLRKWRSALGVPDPKIAIRWNYNPPSAPHPGMGTEAERQQWAIANKSFPSDWNHIRYNNIMLEVSPRLVNGQCVYVSRNSLEAYFNVIAQCVSAKGVNCQANKFNAPSSPSIVGDPTR